MVGEMILQRECRDLGLEEVKDDIEAVLRAGQLVDSMSEHQTDYYFGDDPMHPEHLAGDELFGRIPLQLGERFGTSAGRNAKAQDWLDGINRYQLLLAAIVHLVGGQPPRATELLSVRNANTEFNDRSIIVYDNVVMIWIHHSKNIWRYGKTKPVPRLVPAEVGSHLMLLSPVEARLKVGIQDIVLDKSIDADVLGKHFTFTDSSCRPVPANSITEVLKVWTGKCGLPVLNNRKMRHALIAFSKRHMDCGLDNDDACGAVPKDRLMDQQAGHSTATASKPRSTPERTICSVGWTRSLSQRVPNSLCPSGTC